MARKRNNRRPRGNRRRRRNFRVKRNAPLMRVRARPLPSARSPGWGTLAVNCVRRMVGFSEQPAVSTWLPKKVEPGFSTPVAVPAWLSTIAWILNLVLKIIAVATTGTDDDVPPGYQAGVATVGCVGAFALGPADLLAESGVASHLRQVTYSSPVGKFSRWVFNLHYAQAKFEWVRIHYQPSVKLQNVSGYIAMAFVPRTMSEAVADADAQGSDYAIQVRSFSDVEKLPGVVIGPASKPRSVAWSPSPTDFGYEWIKVGYVGDDSLMSGFHTDKSTRPLSFVFGFSDLSTRVSDSSAYTLDNFLSDFTMEGRVLLREASSKPVNVLGTLLGCYPGASWDAGDKFNGYLNGMPVEIIRVKKDNTYHAWREVKPLVKPCVTDDFELLSV